MELEDILPVVSRRVNDEKLVTVCRQFADVLTEQGWDRQDVLGANIQRTVKRIVTFTEPAGEMSSMKTEREVTVEAFFRADKEQFDFDEERQQPLYEESFTISASLREQIRPDELPEWAMEKLLKNKVFQKREEDDGSDAIQEEPVTTLNYDLLYMCDFERVTEMEYTIDDTGYVEDYTVMCRYVFDEQNLIDERRYSSSETAVEIIDSLSEEAVETFHATFDTVMGEILNDGKEAEQDADAFDSLSTEDIHYRRMLGMVALNAKRFIGMRIK